MCGTVYNILRDTLSVLHILQDPTTSEIISVMGDYNKHGSGLDWPLKEFQSS